MKTSLRTALVHSHISAVAVAVLVLWSLDQGWRALSVPLLGLIGYLTMTIAILDIPYFSYTVADRLTLYGAVAYAFNAAVTLTAAWLLSRWAYGVGPLAALSRYRTISRRRNYV